MTVGSGSGGDIDIAVAVEDDRWAAALGLDAEALAEAVEMVARAALEGAAGSAASAARLVRPVELARGTLLWDRRDIDRWIDTMKADHVEMTRDDILDRL